MKNSDPNVQIDNEKIFYKPPGRETGVVVRYVKTKTRTDTKKEKYLVTGNIIEFPGYKETVHAVVRYIDDSEELVSLDKLFGDYNA